MKKSKEKFQENPKKIPRKTFEIFKAPFSEKYCNFSIENSSKKCAEIPEKYPIDLPEDLLENWCELYAYFPRNVTPHLHKYSEVFSI